jgi:hypothetical protein
MKLFQNSQQELKNQIIVNYFFLIEILCLEMLTKTININDYPLLQLLFISLTYINLFY